jgi:hypothetical protein
MGWTRRPRKRLLKWLLNTSDRVILADYGIEEIVLVLRRQPVLVLLLESGHR